MKSRIIPILALLFCLGLSSHAKDVKLEDLVPVETGFGMANSLPPEWAMQSGEGFIDTKPYGGISHEHWPDAQKIVKSYAKDFAIPEGTRYESRMTDVFAAGGEVYTGVGLWCRNVCSYHWVEYDIPPGATKFTAQVIVTDDVRGICFHPDLAMNRLFVVDILIDGKKAGGTSVNKLGVTDGSGELVDTVSVDIPKGAKRIRFYIESMPMDNNVNNEVVIHGGKFTVP